MARELGNNRLLCAFGRRRGLASRHDTCAVARRGAVAKTRCESAGAFKVKSTARVEAERARGGGSPSARSASKLDWVRSRLRSREVHLSARDAGPRLRCSYFDGAHTGRSSRVSQCVECRTRIKKERGRKGGEKTSRCTDSSSILPLAADRHVRLSSRKPSGLWLPDTRRTVSARRVTFSVWHEATKMPESL